MAPSLESIERSRNEWTRWKPLLLLILVFVAAIALLKWSSDAETAGPFAVAVFVALAIPFALLLVRDYVREQRRRILQGLLAKLGLATSNFPPAAQRAVDWACLKYGATPSATEAEQPPLPADDQREAAKRVALLWASIPYLVFSIAGFVVLFQTISLQMEGPSGKNWLLEMLSWPLDNMPPLDNTIPGRLLNNAQIASAAFLGAYLFTLRYLFKAVLNMELGAFSFMRAAIHLLTGVVVGVLVYRTLHAMGDAWIDKRTMPLGGWVALAFFAGFIPDFFLTTLVRKLRVFGLKSANEEFQKAAQITPLELIDGIDYDIRYRLEENNISDVQNLATYNPLLLFAETPYGLHQIFDWVLQAQLCIAVGPDAYIKLRKVGARTIFDLRELARTQPPDQYLRLIGCLIFSSEDPCAKLKFDLEKADADLTKAKAELEKAETDFKNAVTAAQNAAGAAKADADQKKADAEKIRDAAKKRKDDAEAAKQRAETAKAELSKAEKEIKDANAAIEKADAAIKQAEADEAAAGADETKKKAAAEAKAKAQKEKEAAQKSRKEAQQRKDLICYALLKSMALEPDSIKFAIEMMCKDPYIRCLLELWDYVNGIVPRTTD